MNNKKDSQSIFIPFDEIEKIQKECNKSVIDLKYSLEVDPENKYSFDDVEKEFIKLYVEYKSIPHVANWLNLDESEAKEMYSNTFIQNEIKMNHSSIEHNESKSSILHTIKNSTEAKQTKVMNNITQGIIGKIKNEKKT